MQMKASVLLIILVLSMGSVAYAHPVSYKGALGVMTWNQSFLSDYWITYSFRPDAAFAARGMRMTMKEGSELTVYMPQLDYLVKRWNGDDHQANIYIYGGYGGVSFEGRKGHASLGGIETDAESRKYFVMAKYEAMEPSIGSTFQHVEGRIGVAPYEAEINEIASWFMIQGQYHPALQESFVLTPLARFFYRNVLWETGVSLKGDLMLNLMFHF